MKNNNCDSYKYLRLAHVSALFFGFPYTRRKIKKSTQYEGNAENIAGNHLVFNLKRHLKQTRITTILVSKLN